MEDSVEERKAERGLLGKRKRPQQVDGAKALKVRSPMGSKAKREAKKPIRSLTPFDYKTLRVKQPHERNLRTW